MKRFFLFLVILGMSVLTHAGGWMHDYDKALVEAQKMHKPILMMYSAKD